MFKAPIWSAIICQRQIVVYGKQDNLDNFILRLKVRLNFFLGISIFNFPIADAKSKKSTSRIFASGTIFADCECLACDEISRSRA